MDDATLAALRTAAAAVSDIGFAALVGALATTALLRGARSEWARRGARLARTTFAVATAMALVAGVAGMWVQAMSMTESSAWDAIAGAPDVIVGTQFGHAWAGGIVALLAVRGARRALALRVSASRRVDRRGDRDRRARGRARERGSRGRIGLPAGRPRRWSMHLLAIGAWSGAAIVGALVVGAAPTRDGDAALADADGARYLARLSRLATAALALVVLTGSATAWHEAGGRIGPLLPAAGASAWTWTLAVKLVLVGVAVALGGFNRFATLPPLVAALASRDAPVDAPWRRFARILRIEAVVLLAVLVAAAVLANGEPPVV